MKLGIMQPYFFPYIGYFQLLNAVDKYVILDDVNFIKQGFINKNNILTNGKKQPFSVQVASQSSYVEIRDTFLVNNPKGLKKLVKTIQQSYTKAPYFKEVFPILEELITYDELNLSKYNVNSIKKVCEYLNIKTEIIETSTVYEKGILKGEDRILDLNKKLSSSTYYNAIGGTELYDRQKFNREGIELCFLKINDDFEYKQLKNDFVPYLSIIDVMMFNSKDEIAELLNQYTLV